MGGAGRWQIHLTQMRNPIDCLKMNPIYSFGYGGHKAVELAGWVRKNGAILVDVRFSPSSKDEQWRKANLKELLGEQYVHVQELGNENFKGNEIRIKDLSAGMMRVHGLLQRAPVVIMCACWNRATCHRTLVIRHMVDEWHAEAKVLEPKEIRFPPPPPAQTSLF
jgi:uncharacterized protein (DUF488 family)